MGTKISQLPLVDMSTLTGAELLELVQAGGNVQMTLNDLVDFAAGGSGWTEIGTVDYTELNALSGDSVNFAFVGGKPANKYVVQVIIKVTQAFVSASGTNSTQVDVATNYSEVTLLQTYANTGAGPIQSAQNLYATSPSNAQSSPVDDLELQLSGFNNGGMYSIPNPQDWTNGSLTIYCLFNTFI